MRFKQASPQKQNSNNITAKAKKFTAVKIGVGGCQRFDIPCAIIIAVIGGIVVGGFLIAAFLRNIGR
jgi:hypothetical protein